MRKIDKHFYLIIFILILSFISLNFSSIVKKSYAQINNNNLYSNSDFIITELSEYLSNSNNITSVDIPLASETWNITNMEMNFTDIRLGEEVKTIEDSSDGSSKITAGNNLKGWGVQVNVTEPTIIFGAYIFGYKSIQTPTIPLHFQLNGYDNGTDTPNTNIISSTLFNISTIPNWYLQTFENEVSLVPGQYYLTLNGSQLIPQEKINYYWYFNDSNSVNTKLHTSKYDGSKWNLEATGEPLLYKLIQRVNRTYNPQEINMSLNIDGISYPINSDGSFTLDKTISPTGDVFHIPITNNRSITPLFDLYYRLKLKNFLNTTGNVLIQENSANNWTIEPDIQRSYSNYSIKFKYPLGWYNLRVFRDVGGGWIDITSQVTVNTTNYFVIIPDNIILEGSNW
ncbi:MAG: hypothetical protein R3255_03090, partial [Candidatus Lokiarchaeia archaeon]|nr:hypothetical protein [Candidatus Lokiarchaeia archaeon]